MRYESTDLGNARRLVATYGHHLRYVAEWGRWIVWNGRCWQPDVTGEVMRRAKLTAEQILDEARDDKSEKLFRHALKSQSATGLTAMVNVASTEPTIPVLVSELDADPWLLTVANGTVNLKTGQLHHSDPDDLIAKESPVKWDPNAVCPAFDAFLERILPDSAVRDFVQRAVGYSLTGLTTEHVLLMLHGSGGNGKSVFTETLMRLMGDHAAPASPKLLVVEKHSEHPTAIADLHGRRLVIAQEIEQGHRLDEALVKQLTGGDQLKARFMRQDFWSFTPTHKLWVACNHKPRIRGTDHGIWRRIRLVPFEVTIPATEQDKNLATKLAAELPGILNWALAGCLAWQRDGLEPPDAVVVATDMYAKESDLVAQFLDERCIVGDQYQVRSSDLYAEYKSWCQDNGLDHPLSQKALAQQLDEKGYDRTENRNHQAIWLGVGLLDVRNGFAGETP